VPTLAILNPVAGKHAARQAWEHVREHVDHTRSWECVTTRAAGHARELAQAAARDGYERIVAIGGDGTVCEVANGLALSPVALAIIPTGTGNDLAQNLGIPGNPAAAAALAATGEPRSIDLCHVETARMSAYFVNVAGFGFDADVAWRVNSKPRLFGGTLAYVAGVLETLWRYRSPRMRIGADGRLVEGAVFLVAVGNCPSYGGGMRIVPNARPDDGLMDVCIVHDLSRFQVLKLLPRLYSGGHVGHPAVELLRCREITADAHDRVLCHADGELVGELPARFEILPAALRCVTGPVSGSPS
jgi:YegS/Rv2252/BmrU family lipid kinase